MNADDYREKAVAYAQLQEFLEKTERKCCAYLNQSFVQEKPEILQRLQSIRIHIDELDYELERSRAHAQQRADYLERFEKEPYKNPAESGADSDSDLDSLTDQIKGIMAGASVGDVSIIVVRKDSEEIG